MSEAWSTYCDRYRLTPAQAKLFALLADGATHEAVDVQKALGITAEAGRTHIHHIRKKVARHGVRIITTVGGYRAFVPKVDA